MSRQARRPRSLNTGLSLNLGTDGSRAGSKRAKADRQTRDEETAIDGNKKAAHKAEMQRRKEKRDRHLDKAGNASKDSKQDDGQTAILNFSYYDNKP
ncbi:hypothetical protein WJX84_001055 [Apatococcus fuscideae]|uniref:Small EDRK-rich factor-like N-terminal domain-containing protein n=1 Tax=Apatococcus fuscideae TaxID=2026836 RepID=A0AAW1STF2_9CHLO